MMVWGCLVGWLDVGYGWGGKFVGGCMEWCGCEWRVVLKDLCGFVEDCVRVVMEVVGDD